MKILELKLTHFRNYDQGVFLPGSNVNILCGENAQGKTNILEAVFLCCLGRSHRTPRDKELISYGQDMASVELSCEKTGVTRRIRVNLFPDQRRKVFIDSLPAGSIGELMGQLNCVLFAPEHLSIVKQGPSERRRFLDMEISQTYPSYFYALQQYGRVLRQRNNLLKSAHENKELLSTLPVWDEQLAKLASFITSERQKFIERLSRIAEENHGDLSGGREKLILSYQPMLKQTDTSFILEELERSRDKDIRFRTTHTGPHRDDFAMLLNGKDLRAFGSQGQQRTAALSLKLSQIDLIHDETGEWPILMLDDVLSELDQNRQRYLLERVLPVQTLLTTTQLVDSFTKADVYYVENGKIQKA